MGSFKYQIIKQEPCKGNGKVNFEPSSRDECIRDLEELKEKYMMTSQSQFLLNGDILVDMQWKNFTGTHTLKGYYSHTQS